MIDGAAYLTCGESGSYVATLGNIIRPPIYGKTWLNSRELPVRRQHPFSSGEKGFVVSGKVVTTQLIVYWEFHPNEYDDDEYVRKDGLGSYRA